MRRIRQAQATDHQAVVACVRAAYSKYLARMDKEPAPLHTDYEALIAQGVVSVLTEGEAVQGVLVMMLQQNCFCVENIAVDPCFQGQGLGKMLMAFVEQQARKEQVKEIRLYTNEVMTENLLFYQKLGFEEEDRHIQDGYRRVFLHKVLA
jgi:ribosomal protein S18 acetylase RimI-like enzyme